MKTNNKRHLSFLLAIAYSVLMAFLLSPMGVHAATEQNGNNKVSNPFALIKNPNFRDEMEECFDDCEEIPEEECEIEEEDEGDEDDIRNSLLNRFDEDDEPEDDEEDGEWEECEFFPEDEDDEEGDEGDEGDDGEEGEECEDAEECEAGDDEGETDNAEQISVFTNPNPAADRTIVEVTTAQANDASRFLNQATMGANYATITQVAKMGKEQWLNEQFQQPVGYITPYTRALVDEANRIYGIDEESEEELTLEEEERRFDMVMARLGDPERFYLNGWWTQALSSPDVLRQRVATALSEIFVVSLKVEELGTQPYPLSQYYDTLLEHSFGNYRDLLKAVTLNPAMGLYLSHVNNAKSNPTTGTFPDENYAREVMQLFSIGLFELNPDGSRKKDAQGNDIATYDNADIREFAKIFTGLTYGGEEIYWGNQEAEGEIYLYPMVMFEEQHEPGEKKLLNNQVVPAGQTGMQNIDAAIDNLFNHPNVGPFFGKLLIQRLVTSNPSPAYVSRVSAAFNGGNGIPRGDMKHLIQTILLDPEARQSPAQNQTTGGRLREPFLRLVHLMRAFNITSMDNTFNDNGFEFDDYLRQNIFSSPSVFNFFQPGYSPNGLIKDNGLVAPEFQITTAATILSIKNLILEATLYETPLLPVGQLPVGKLHLENENVLAADPAALLDRLDTVLTYGTLSQSTRDQIISAISQLDNQPERVLLALYLIMISPDYAVAI